MPWTCAFCTLENGEAAKVCAVCESARPAAEDSESAQLLRALEESAAQHSSSTNTLLLTGRFTFPRRHVRVLPCLPEPASDSASDLLQVGALNQFHPHWQPLIAAHQTPSATCGYMSCAYATLLARLPEGACPRSLEELLELVQDVGALEPLVEDAMRFVRDSRLAYVAAHPQAFAPHATGKNSNPKHYEKAWVANYVRWRVRHGALLCPTSPP